jgi:hypothetical protein
LQDPKWLQLEIDQLPAQPKMRNKRSYSITFLRPEIQNKTDE